ncbi:MAG: hypothetical protein HYX94_04435 [Chloroflexi bacterium]|nr:hypothetical protein [Chloroflexota bacterium]
MALRDKKTEWLRVQMYRQMSPDERVLSSVRMFEDLVSIVRSSILDANPGILPEVLEREVRRRVLPRGLAELADTKRRQSP